MADKCSIAITVSERVRGLLGTSELKDGFGMLIVPCSSIHTFFMRYPIDVAFLDGKMRIVHLVESLPPWRICLPRGTGAKMALELPSGRLMKTNTAIGDELEIKLLAMR
ncbi:MAG: DUF192 domain-containing protein [Armatimonadota bacterium]|nr:DUF192 domain-containing protein [Armatimonadota bacterium]MCX7777821.1 DUF192 domain-containing protein [Armatimonadota bacterium]MDW8025935.1 DUF192 domain-containing protein [Armatimonadota bacterium]